MLGGFIKQSQENGNSGVPLLKDIPVLGNLFKSKSRKNTSTELIILLRATVLETPEEAAMMARQEKQSLLALGTLSKPWAKKHKNARKSFCAPENRVWAMSFGSKGRF